MTLSIASRLDLPQLTPRWLIHIRNDGMPLVVDTVEIWDAIAQTERAIARAAQQKARRLRAARRRRKERRRSRA